VHCDHHKPSFELAWSIQETPKDHVKIVRKKQTHAVINVVNQEWWDEACEDEQVEGPA